MCIKKLSHPLCFCSAVDGFVIEWLWWSAVPWLRLGRADPVTDDDSVPWPVVVVFHTQAAQVALKSIIAAIATWASSVSLTALLCLMLMSFISEILQFPGDLGLKAQNSWFLTDEVYAKSSFLNHKTGFYSIERTFQGWQVQLNFLIFIYLFYILLLLLSFFVRKGLSV